MDHSELPPPVDPQPEPAPEDANPRSWRQSAFVRQAAFIFIVVPLVIAANLAVWAAFNQPHHAEAWTGEIVGLSYRPYRPGQDPTQTRHPPLADREAHIRRLSGTLQATPTSTAIRAQEHIPELAAPSD